MFVEIAWKQNILVTDFHLLKSLLVVLGFGSQAFVCGFSRQNINSEVVQRVIFMEQTEYEIWTDFGQIGSTEKKYGSIMINFKRCLFHSRKINLDFLKKKYCGIHTYMLHKI